MKKAIYLIALLLVAACKKDGMPYHSEFDASLKQWNIFKTSANNSYSYIAYSASVFGASSTTKISVQNGKVVGREYSAFMLNQTTHQNELKTSWTENQATLNTHTSGAASLTLDEIYQKAQTEWLIADKKANDITFETGADGLISSCGYTPHNCQDDCFLGINIQSVTKLY